MPNFGEKLRAARAAKQLTPQQIEFDTRIRAVVISALEEEEFGNLPPEPYTRGLLRNYARYLGLDAEELLEEYTSAVSAKKPPPPEQPAIESPPAPPVESFQAPRLPSTPVVSELSLPASIPEISDEERPSELASATPDTVPEYEPRTSITRRIPVAPEVLAFIIVVFVVFAMGYTAYTQLLGGARSSAPTQAAGRVTDVVVQTPTVIDTSAPNVPTPVPTFVATIPPALLIIPTATTELNVTRTLTTTAEGEMLLSVEVQQQTVFLWLIADNQEVYKGNLEAGAAKEFTAKARMYLQIKNIPNAKVTFNGKAILPATFAERAVLERAWIMSPRGTPIAIAPDVSLITPIVIEPLTPTRSPLPTNTPARTNTPRPAPTETPAG